MPTILPTPIYQGSTGNTHARCDVCLKPLPFGAVSDGRMRHADCSDLYMTGSDWYNARAVREGLDAERQRAWRTEKAHAEAQHSTREANVQREAKIRAMRTRIPTFHPDVMYSTVTGTTILDAILRTEARAYAVSYHDALPHPVPTHGGERVWQTSFEEQSVPYQDERVAAAETLLRNLSIPASFDSATRRLGRLASLRYVAKTAPTWTRHAWGWELRGRGIDVITFGPRHADGRVTRVHPGLEAILDTLPDTADEEALIVCLVAQTRPRVIS